MDSADILFHVADKNFIPKKSKVIKKKSLEVPVHYFLEGEPAYMCNM